MSKLIKCKTCGQEIAKGVKKCVHCGKDQRNFFMKHKILTGIIVLAILGGIASIGNKPKKVGETKPTTASTTSTKT
ncbi:MAG: hypothetical protein VB130_07525, partial [Clostridium sp.]|nr:hypothetical protein [Clostridium sp.]